MRGLLCWAIMALMAMPWALANAPSLSRVDPPGFQRGTEAEITLLGNNLEDTVDLMFHDPGLELVEIVETSGGSAKVKLRAAADTPTGTKAIRVRTKTGLSQVALISVGNLPESGETEPNNTAETANAITLDFTVNGAVQSEDVDYYSVELAEGQRLAVEVEALRLGVDLFDPKLRLFGPGGHELIAEDDTALARQDAAFVHTATEAGVFKIAVSEASYGGAGHYVYRLHVGTFPRPFAAVPYGGKPGETVEVRWLGDSALAAQPVALPDSAEPTFALAVETESGVAPTPLPFRVNDLPGFVEAEPNNQVAEATAGVAPGAFHGVIESPGDVDHFKFDATNGQKFKVSVWARSLGSPLDSVLVAHKPSGGAVTSSDDLNGPDSGFDLNCGEDGAFTLAIYDHLRRGGPEFAYRIEVAPTSRSLSVGLRENRPASVAIPQGGYSYLLTSASRSGFGEPVTLTLADLPEGVTAEPAAVPSGQAAGIMLLSATAEAPLAGSLVKYTGTATIGEETLEGGFEQEVRLIEGNNDTTFFGRNVNRVATAVVSPPPFTFNVVAPKAPMVVADNRKLTVEVTRAEGFGGAIDLYFPWLPNGFGSGTAKVGGDATSAEITLAVNGGDAVGEHQLVIGARGAGYEICTAPFPVTVEPRWVLFELADLEAEQGQTVEMPVTLTQNAPYEGEHELRLYGLARGVTAEPQPITSATEKVVFPLTVAEDAQEGKSGRIFAAVGIPKNGERVYHQSGTGHLKVYKPLPPELKAAAPPPKPETPDAPEEPERKTRFPVS